MDDWFQRLSAECSLEPLAARALDQNGFAAIEGPVSADQFEQLGDAYDLAMSEAEEPDKRVGRMSTRVHDLANRGAAFDGLYQHPPLLAACCQTIRQPFKLSNMPGRTLHARSGCDEVHVDAAPDQAGWPMLGFIVMVDEFTMENGATRFWPGPHHLAVGVEAGPIPKCELAAACGTLAARLASPALARRSFTRTGRRRRWRPPPVGPTRD